MRRRAHAAAALAALLVLLAPAAADAKRVRVFAVGPKFDLSWVDTREHYRDKLVALFDKSKRGPGTPLIQKDSGEVAGARLGPADPAKPVETARDLVTLPEDIGLMAAFVGERGRGARSVTADSGGLTSAIASLIVSYGPVNAYYSAKFPELAGRGVPTRLLAVSLTDTFARTAVETFAELADRYDVWLEAGVNMTQDWQVVCASRATFKPLPGGVGCDEENAGKVAQLRSPDEPGRDYAYEATSSKASNMALLFDPSGKLVSKQVKTYLTPTELPGQLDLLPGEVSAGLSAVETPVGTLGFVTSKDSWMPDVTQKLDQRHVELLVQPEFFVNDTVRTSGMWSPDTLKSSGYADVLRHPSINAMVLSEMTGNVYDFSADAQQHIVLKPRALRRGPSGGLVGQPQVPGFANVQPWVVKDPLAPDEPFADRRRRLGRAGEAMLPLGDGPACPKPDEPGPCKGGQVEGVIFQDVQVQPQRVRRPKPARKRGRTPFTVNRPISPAPFVQRNVALAALGRRTVAAFEERRRVGDRLRDQIVLVRSGDRGAHWSARVSPTGRPAGAADEWWPRVALGPDGTVWVAWQDDSSGTMRVYFARSSDGGASFSPPVAVDATPPAKVAQWKPSIAATGAGAAVVAWVDERTRFTVDDLPQAGIWLARIEGDRPQAAVRIDSTGPPNELSRTLDNSWAPSVATRGNRVLVAWLDFRSYDWRVYARESADGGATFAAEKAVTDAPAADEALDDTPRAGLGDRGALVAFTDWRKRASSATRPHQLYDIMIAEPGGPNRRVDPHGEQQLLSFSPALLTLPRGQALVAWQDMARGPGDILIARVKPGGAGGRARRVDDSGTAGWNQWRPQLALTSGRVLAAWEDERDGPAQIYAARAKPSAIR